MNRIKTQLNYWWKNKHVYLTKTYLIRLTKLIFSQNFHEYKQINIFTNQ